MPLVIYKYKREKKYQYNLQENKDKYFKNNSIKYSLYFPYIYLLNDI